MKALLIEDDIFYKTKLLMLLDELGIKVVGIATDVAEGIEFLKRTTPDVIITDVILKTGTVFDIFNSNSNFWKIPTVFITNSDMESYYNEAQKILKHIYIVKPIHKLTLKSAIESVFDLQPKKVKEYIPHLQLRGKYNEKIELPLEKIVYVKQSQHYCTISTSNQQFVMKKSLVNLMKELDERFLQIHRSYCVNTNYIINFATGLDAIRLENGVLPIGLTYKDSIKKLIAERFSVKQ